MMLRFFLIALKEPNNDSPKPNEIYRIGVVSKSFTSLKLQTANMKILVEDVKRVKIVNFITDKDYLQAEVKLLNESQENIKKT